MKGQAAIEYFTIVSVALLILLPLSLYVNQLLTGYRDDTRISLAKDAVKKLGESADWVWSQGPPARLTLKVYIPEGVESTSLDNNMILFKIRTSAGITGADYETVSSLNGSIPTTSGHYRFSVVANQDNVTISVV